MGMDVVSQALLKRYVKDTADGLGAVKGKDGFSPIISENENNDNNTFKLDITTASGVQTTSNIMPNINNLMIEDSRSVKQLLGISGVEYKKYISSDGSDLTTSNARNAALTGFKIYGNTKVLDSNMEEVTTSSEGNTIYSAKAKVTVNGSRDYEFKLDGNVIELNKVGYSCDTLEILQDGSATLTRRTSDKFKIDSTYSSKFSLNKETNDCYVFRCTALASLGCKEGTKIISNRWSMTGTERIEVGGTFIYFYVLKSYLSEYTVDSFIEYLDSNDFWLYYELAESKVKTITIDVANVPSIISDDGENIYIVGDEITSSSFELTQAEYSSSYNAAVPRHYNNIALALSDDTLKTGDIIITAGYYDINDGGSGKYMVVSINDTDKCIVKGVNFNLQLIYNGCINLQCLGAKGDRTFNNTSLLTYAFKFTNTVELNDGYYLLNTSWWIANKDKKFIGNGHLRFDVFNRIEENDGEFYIPYFGNPIYEAQFLPSEEVNTNYENNKSGYTRKPGDDYTFIGDRKTINYYAGIFKVAGQEFPSTFTLCLGNIILYGFKKGKWVKIEDNAIKEGGLFPVNWDGSESPSIEKYITRYDDHVEISLTKELMEYGGIERVVHYWGNGYRLKEDEVNTDYSYFIGVHDFWVKEPEAENKLLITTGSDARCNADEVTDDNPFIKEVGKSRSLLIKNYKRTAYYTNIPYENLYEEYTKNDFNLYTLNDTLRNLVTSEKLKYDIDELKASIDEAKVDKPTNGDVAVVFNGSVSDGSSAEIPIEDGKTAAIFIYGGSSTATVYGNYFVSGTNVINMANGSSGCNYISVANNTITITHPEGGGIVYKVTM